MFSDTDGKKASIPGERQKTANIGELDIVHYGGNDESSSDKAQSEVGSKVGSSVHGKSVSKSGAGKWKIVY